MADCIYTIEGSDKTYSESEFKKLLSEGYLDKVMMDKNIKIRGIKPDEAMASSFQIPSAVQPQAPTEVKSDYQIAQDATNEVSKENPDASVLLTPKGEDLSLTAVYVAKENRGKGIGTKVLESVKKQADKLGKKVVLDATTELDEETDLGRLESFYEKNGFTKVGDNKFEYNPTAEVTEAVTPEIKTEEVVTPTETVTKTEEVVTEPTTEVKEQEQKINVNPLQGYSFTYESEQDIPNELKGVSPIVRSESTIGRGKKAKTNIRLTFSGQQLIDAGLGQQEGQTTTETKVEEQAAPEAKNKLTKKDLSKLTSEEMFDIYDGLSEELKDEHFRYGVGPNMTSQPSKMMFFTKLKNAIGQEEAISLITERQAKSSKTKQPTKEAQVAKGLADTLRKAKFNLPKGTAMASFAPGFDKVWDATIETVAKAIEAGGVTVGNFRKSINDGMKALKNTDAYKAITDIRERDRITSEYRKSLLEKIPQFFNVDPTEDFGNVWDSSMDIVNDSLSKSNKTPAALQKAIDEGFKDVKKSTWYNALDKDQKQQFAADYNDAMNRMFPINKEKASKEKVSKEEKEQGKEFKDKVSGVTGTVKPEKTIRLSESELIRIQLKYGNLIGKEVVKNIQDIKERIREYAQENLPKDDYSVKEVNSLMRSLSAAKTEKGLERSLDRIDALVARKLEKQEAQDRKTLIKSINDKIKANSKQVIRRDRRTRRKQGKITIPAQQELNQAIQDLKDQGLFNNLESLTTEELSDLNDSLDNIIKTGRVEQKALTALEQAKIKSDKAMILRSLNSSPDDILNGEEEINERLDKTDGHVIVDDQLMSHSDFKDYVKKNPDADLDNVEFYYNRDASKVREKLERDTTIRQRIRNTTLWTVSDLETHLAKLGAKAKGLKTWIEGNIAKPIREGRRKSIETVWRETRAYKKKTREIFDDEASMFKALTAPTSVKAKNSTESLSAGQVVHLFNILNNTDPEKREADAKRLMKKNYISAEDVFNFMKKPENYQLLNYAAYLAQQYNGPLRTLFGPTIENLHTIDLGSDYYYPQPASKSEAENITDSNNNISLSVTAPNMRHREENPTSGFELIDAHQMYLSYIDSMSHAKEFIPVVKAINTLISDVNRPYIMEKFGSAADYSDFIQTLKNTVTNESLYKPGAMTAYLNSVSLSLLWFRIQSVPQQMSSMIHYYHAGIKDGVYPHDVLRAVPTNKKELEFVKDFYADNPYLYNRLGGANIDPEMKKLKEQIDSNANKLVKGTLSFIQFAGLFPIKFGDATAAASIGGGMSFALAQYKQAFKETGDASYAKEHALQRWFEETERTGQVSVAREIMSTKSFDNVVRLFIPFSSAQQGVIKKIYKSYLNTKDWKNLDAKEKAQTVSDLIYFSVFAPLPFLMSGAIGYAFVSMLSDDDEDEKEMTRLLYDLGTDAAQSHLTALGLPGLLLNTATNIARDKSHFNESPAYSRKEDIALQLVKMLNNNKTWDDLTLAERKEFIKNYKGERFGSFENTYNESSMWDRATRKDIDEALESIGILNLSKLYDKMANLGKSNDFASIAAFALGVDRTRTEMNKKLDSYFNKAVESGKKDVLFETGARIWRDATGENVDTKYIPQGAEKPKKIRSSSSKPFSFNQPGPSPFKKKF